MLESSAENKCLRISGSGNQAQIIFKVYQMNSMWNQVFYESISEQMEVKFDPHVELPIQITEVTNG